MFIFSSICSGLKFNSVNLKLWSVNDTSVNENSKMTFQNI